MRKIYLSYQKNVRDICGLVGFNGKKVKEGKIYRGGFLGRLSDKDVETIKSLKLTDIVDFRSSVENKTRPDHYFKGVTYHNFPAMDESSDEGLKAKNDYDDSNLLWFLGDSVDGFAHMYNVYPELCLTNPGIKAYRSFFEVLLKDPNRVVYFHCSQGKDRAGVAAFLLEIALGVSKEDAIEEYMLTNEAMEVKIKQLKAMLYNKPYYNKEYEMALSDVFTAKKEYINHAIEEVESRFGTVLNYIKEVLNVDVEKLREYYLE